MFPNESSTKASGNKKKQNFLFYFAFLNGFGSVSLGSLPPSPLITADELNTQILSDSSHQMSICNLLYTKT